MLSENEKKHILKTLELTNWQISGENCTAMILEINHTTLEARIYWRLRDPNISSNQLILLGKTSSHH